MAVTIGTVAYDWQCKFSICGINLHSDASGLFVQIVDSSGLVHVSAFLTHTEVIWSVI